MYQLLWEQINDDFYGYFEDNVKTSDHKAIVEIHFDQKTNLYFAYLCSSPDVKSLILEPNENLGVLKELIDEYLTYDYLTHVFTKRYLVGFLMENEISKAKNNNYPLAFLFSDIDHLKMHSISFGHHEGDIAIKTIVALIKKSLRPSDFLGRVGGDEFGIKLPQTNLEEAEEIAEKICGLVDSHPFPLTNSGTRLSISIGASCLGELMNKETDELIKVADERMYARKWLKHSNNSLKKIV